MLEYYQPFLVEDVQKDDAAILEVLTAIMQKKLSNDLSLLNYYKEIPISFGATVDYVERAFTELTVHHTQALAIMHQKMTFLKSAHFRHDVLAKVQRVQIEKDRIFLAQYSYVQIRAERRQDVRVKMTNSIDVAFQCEALLIKGLLNDISIGGMSLLAGQSGVEEGSLGKVTLCLDGTKLEIPGTILRILDVGTSKKYLIKFETTHHVEDVLSRFIFQIQNEIIRELKNQHEK
jgi:hypothetical protein